MKWYEKILFFACVFFLLIFTITINKEEELQKVECVNIEEWNGEWVR